MVRSNNLDLPFIMPSRGQKHVTHKEAFRALDAVVHLAIIDDGATTTPADLAEGDRYIVGAEAIGGWAAHESRIAAF